MNLIKNLFFNPSRSPQKRDSYAVDQGDYCGEFFVFIERIKNTLYFLSLPKMVIREVSKTDFDQGIKKHIINFAERLPIEIYKVCCQQFRTSKIDTKKNLIREKSNNRLQQSTVPNLPHQQNS